MLQRIWSSMSVRNKRDSSSGFSGELPLCLIKLMKKPLLILLVVISGMWISGCSGHYEDSAHCQNGGDYEACIAIKSEDCHLKVNGYCLNNTPEDSVLRYELKAKKLGEAGRAETCQSGSVEVRSRQKECLSQLELSVYPKDRYQIELKVYKDGKLVAEDFVSYPKEL